MQVFQTENDIGIALCTLPLHVLFHHHKDLLVLLVDQKKCTRFRRSKGCTRSNASGFVTGESLQDAFATPLRSFCINIQHY